jgi:hypothetical protein
MKSNSNECANPHKLIKLNHLVMTPKRVAAGGQD